MLSDLEVKRVAGLVPYPVVIAEDINEPDLYLISFIAKGKKWIFSTRFHYFMNDKGERQDLETAEQGSQMLAGLILKILKGESVTE